MSTVGLKSKIVRKINSISDTKILMDLHSAISDIKSYEGKDFWDELSITQKRNIELSLKQSKEGKTVSHESVQQEVKQWLKR